MHIQHEGGESALQPRQRAGEHDETGPGELGRPLEVHQAKRFADLEVMPGAAVHERLLTPTPDFDVGALIGPFGHLVIRQVGKAREQRVELGGERLLFPFQRQRFVLQPCDLGNESGSVLTTRAGSADLLRHSVARLLAFLKRGLNFAPAGIEREYPVGMWFHAAPGQAAVEQIAVLANPSGAEHDGAACNRRKSFVNKSLQKIRWPQVRQAGPITAIVAVTLGKMGASVYMTALRGLS